MISISIKVVRTANILDEGAQIVLELSFKLFEKSSLKIQK